MSCGSADLAAAPSGTRVASSEGADGPMRPCRRPSRGLTSMRSQAIPSTTNDWRAHRRRGGSWPARSSMRCFSAGGTSLTYFTGLRWETVNMMALVALPAKGDAFIVCPAFEVDRLNSNCGSHRCNPTGFAAGRRNEVPYQRVARTLRGRHCDRSSGHRRDRCGSCSPTVWPAALRR